MSVKVESVQFARMMTVKGRGRDASQIAPDHARSAGLEMTWEPELGVLRVESPIGVQIIPLQQVKSMTLAQEKEKAKK